MTTVRIRLLRVALVGVALAFSAYMAVTALGGFLVFGFSNFEEFALFAAPVVAFPVALIALWKPRVAAAVFAALFVSCLTVHAKLVWPNLREIFFGPWHFVSFLVPTISLCFVALLPRCLGPADQ